MTPTVMSELSHIAADGVQRAAVEPAQTNFSHFRVDVRPWCLQLCLMRALALDEGRLARAARKLDLALLDAVTWPEFVWDHLKRVGDDLHRHR